MRAGGAHCKLPFTEYPWRAFFHRSDVSDGDDDDDINSMIIAGTWNFLQRMEISRWNGG